MTAVNVFTRPDGIVVFTDGTVFDDDRICRGFQTKADVYPHSRSFIATIGNGDQGNLARILLANHSTFDDLRERAWGKFSLVIDQALKMRWPINVEVIFGGYSSADQRWEIWSMGESRDGEQIESWCPVQIENFVFPAVDDETLSAAGLGQLAGDDDVVRLMNIQRQQPQRFVGGAQRRGCIVGGFIMQSFVGDDYAWQKIIHRWPTDEIGKPIGEGDPEIQKEQRLENRP